MVKSVLNTGMLGRYHNARRRIRMTWRTKLRSQLGIAANKRKLFLIRPSSSAGSSNVTSERGGTDFGSVDSDRAGRRAFVGTGGELGCSAAGGVPFLGAGRGAAGVPGGELLSFSMVVRPTQTQLRGRTCRNRPTRDREKNPIYNPLPVAFAVKSTRLVVYLFYSMVRDRQFT